MARYLWWATRPGPYECGYIDIDDETPPISIAPHERHCGKSFGTVTIQAMLLDTRGVGYRGTSLFAQKENLVLRLYGRLGFCVVGVGLLDTK